MVGDRARPQNSDDLRHMELLRKVLCDVSRDCDVYIFFSIITFLYMVGKHFVELGAAYSGRTTIVSSDLRL